MLFEDVRPNTTIFRHRDFSHSGKAELRAGRSILPSPSHPPSPSHAPPPHRDGRCKYYQNTNIEKKNERYIVCMGVWAMFSTGATSDTFRG